MRSVPLPDPDPVVAAAVRAMFAGKRAPLAVVMRDRLGGWMDDELFAEAFSVRGCPGLPPAMLAVVTVLQHAENLRDRQAAEAVRTRLDWKYALGLPLDDPGFDHSVLSEFRIRVSSHGLEGKALDALLARLAADGLVTAGGKQRTDSTHVIAQVRALHAVELAGEAVRAALEALAAASPDWLAARFCTGDWTRRYGARIDSWRLPPGKAERDNRAIEYAHDGYALVAACYQDSAPAWARELPAVQVLRTVLVQNFLISSDSRGREVISRREPGLETGVPPAHIRIASPYDTDARWSVKKDLTWLGCKLHITETCDDPPACGCPPVPPGRCRHDTRPSLITRITTTTATVPDAVMTIPLSAALHRTGLAPARHYLDSGYASPQAMLDARRYGITLVTPLLADNSRQAREGNGYDRSAFTIDYDARTVTCPQGSTSRAWTPARPGGKDAIIIQFRISDCRPCPARQLCTTSARSGRQLMVPPRGLLELQAAARASQDTKPWQDDYKRRAGIEGTISQAVTITGCRRARYRGLARTRLQHVYTAVALNLCRLDAYWNDTPINRTRTSHLARPSPPTRRIGKPINHQHQRSRPRSPVPTDPQGWCRETRSGPVPPEKAPAENPGGNIMSITAASTHTPAASSASFLARRPVWQVSYLSGLAASVAVETWGLAARAAGVPMRAAGLGSPHATPVTVGMFAMGTMVVTFWFTFAVVLIARFAKNPKRTYLRTALPLLALSLVVPLTAADTAISTKLTLATAHLIAGAIIIPTVARRLS